MFNIFKQNLCVLQVDFACGNKEAVLAKAIKARTPVQKRGIETRAKVIEAAKALEVLDRDLLRSGEGRKTIHALIQAIYDIHASQYDLHRALFPLTFLIEDGLTIGRQEEQMVIETIAAYFENYRHLLRVTNMRAAAEIAFKASDEIIHRILFWGSQSDGPELLLELEDMLFRYLMRPPEAV